MPSIRSHLWRSLLNTPSAWKPPRGLEVQALSHFGLDGEWLIPANASSDHVVLYLHGGGDARMRRAMVGHIAKSAGTRVFLLDYRHAPANTAEAALEDGVIAYRWLIQQGYDPECITIAGDSSGGGVVLAMANTLLATRVPMPGRVLLISPSAIDQRYREAA